jgi:Holliday junction resolvase-like predicted endonuclease
LGLARSSHANDAAAQAGENEAARFFHAQGCRILARNALVPFGEADLLCQDPSGLVILVEVKARVRRADASPRSRTIAPGANITFAKRRKLARIASYLKARNTWPQGVRIDVIEVELTESSQGTLRVLATRHHRAIVRA